ncbi:MAG TPA: cation:proton antiporter, partial [Elusimicrobiota bacterium]|nr:cation:proton antiporter [Elusimicrobiota bacterium]
RGGRAELGEAEFFAALLLLFASALCTELIGVHALFGAFLAGTVVPRDPALRRALRERLEGVSAHLLVPLFFAFTGLRTRLDGLGSDALTAFLLIMSAAVVGKVAGSALAARGTGMGWQDSLSLGALMNTRGLMELVVLNVGYDMGILSGPIFALLVLMALLTTLMTGPALDLLAGAEPLAAAVEPG